MMASAMKTTAAGTTPAAILMALIAESGCVSDWAT